MMIEIGATSSVTNERDIAVALEQLDVRRRIPLRALRGERLDGQLCRPAPSSPFQLEPGHEAGAPLERAAVAFWVGRLPCACFLSGTSSPPLMQAGLSTVGEISR